MKMDFTEANSRALALPNFLAKRDFSLEKEDLRNELPAIETPQRKTYLAFKRELLTTPTKIANNK